MSETYEITTPNGLILQVDKDTNKILYQEDNVERGKYTEEYSKALLEAWRIMEEAKKRYKPICFDPTLKTNPNHFKEFQSFRNLYLKDPIKKAIAPWTKKEKAYYESLQTKRERYQYLVIRSGLRSAVIDIPFDAIGGVDEKGRVINEDYEDIFYQVDRNKDTLKSEFFATEWGIAAGILGNPEYFASDLTGFTARYVQSTILYIQLNPKIDYRGILKIIEIYGKDYVGSFRTFKSGLRKNPLRQQQLRALAKKIKPDRFGMLPYIDEIMGVDWVMDLNMLYGYAIDGDGWTIEKRIKEIDEGKLLDPRDPKATEQTRREFKKRMKSIKFRRYDADLPNDWTQKQVDLYIDSMLLEAKIMAVTPPQGYPNAPTYYIPEYLDELYEAGKLDKKLNPTIPAIYRESFPQELRDKIKWYAKKHHIK
ncbi:hypothetical protein [uncultured Helicobacter sp.]|uniref:hypothetical protein n=1 Tax=uncultured Helicobacter sp. TaxID=175537 RepID=UPI00260CD970|nr:hypothetical protein [uncultured Helicobacter sp.]